MELRLKPTTSFGAIFSYVLYIDDFTIQTGQIYNTNQILKILKKATENQ